RRELRREPPVHLDQLRRPVWPHEELHVEEAVVEAQRRQNASRDVRELRAAAGVEARRVLEALEAVRPRVLQRVRDADRREATSVDVALERHLETGEERLHEEAVGRLAR